MRKEFEPNPLAIFNIQQVPHCYAHFQKITISLRCNEKIISDWMHTNVRGRFYINNKNQKGELLLGFENPGEAVYFSLLADQINKYTGVEL